MSGRQIRVHRARSDACGGTGCARFTFAELCDQPFGASDYLAIAEQYGAILIEHIPQMSVEKNRNQMRRFITLLDVLYDANVRLICSAAAEPLHLFESPKKNAGIVALAKESMASVLLFVFIRQYLTHLFICLCFYTIWPKQQALVLKKKMKSSLSSVPSHV
jgi:predicted ATPase